MKKNLLFCLFFLATHLLVSAQCTSTDLIISQYLEGGSFNKCIEIYNGTGATVDLSTYTLEIYFNGNTTAGNTVTLSGMLAAGDVFVVCDNGTTLITPDLAATGSFFNGDDAITLSNGGAVIDSFGQLGNDPGSEWSSGGCGTANETLSKDLTGPGACPVDTTPMDTFDPSAWAGGGTGCAAQDNIDGLGSAGPLPVELASFTAVLQANEVQLNWKTLSELDNDYFVVERSLDGQKFEQLAKIDGAGTTLVPQDYSFLDTAPATTNYYRIKQIDFSGMFEYSAILSLNLKDQESDIKLYPSLVAESLTIETTTDLEKVNIIDITGRVVLAEVFDGFRQANINVTSLASGSYFITVKTVNRLEMLRFIKQ